MQAYRKIGKEKRRQKHYKQKIERPNKMKNWPCGKNNNTDTFLVTATKRRKMQFINIRNEKRHC